MAVTKRRLAAISKCGICNGNTRKQIFDKLAAGDTDRLFDAISNAVQHGDTVEKAVEAVKKELEKTDRFVKTETDTIINGIANDANMAFAEKNKSYLIYCAVLDDRVCGDCASLDGEVYAHDDPELPFIPRHPNCRCSLWPVPEEYKNAEPVSFAEYIASLTPKEQKARLGKSKYAAWKKGDYTLRRYETPNVGQRTNIKEIGKRDNEALAKTKIDFDPHKIMTITSPATRKAVVCLRRYTCGEDGMYRTINSYMLAGPAAERNEYIEWIIDGIDSFMSVSTLAKDQFVYRGIKSKSLYDYLMSGEREVQIRFYQSTSLSQEVASRYAGHVQGESVLTKILLPAGTNCVDVSKISTAPDPEEEILVNATGKLSYKSLYYNEKTKQLEGYAVYEK
ncbi:MAG: minor capsid protein [Lentisphaeria bacterium]|nr:minor capsid protein [Lentisphaeria bacterium]